MHTSVYNLDSMTTSESADIAQGLRQRDPELLDRLIEQYQHRLVRYLHGLTADSEWSKDLFQETWIRVLERGHQYDGKRDFTQWLYAIARNLALDNWRRKKGVSLEELIERDSESGQFSDSTTPPWEEMARREEARNVRSELAGIAEVCREVLLIGYISRDARRRAMKVWLWTLVAFFTPHGLGIILYFFLRQPLGVAPTPVDLPSDSSFCPRCGHSLSPVAS